MLKFRFIGSSQTQPKITAHGTTKSAICVEEPTATPSARSIMPLYAAVTAVACSAALPTIGNNITPMKAFDKPYVSDTTSIVSTKHSEHKKTTKVQTDSSAADKVGDKAPSSTSSSPSSANRSACVRSMNHRNIAYTTTRNMEQIREIVSVSSKVTESDTVEKQVGKQMLMDATSWQDMLAAAPWALNSVLLRTTPEVKMAKPRTSSKFESTEPNNAPCTTVIKPARTA
mmetsp:Transcript_7071/g.20106  ORF Transcript_7071/g.20106 Transcript_7071/m.20106 type:complete len:229 (+) Transcript_7071:314-1000(+)